MTFPARLHVLIAPQARSGVVIRRGPSEQVCFVGWDMARDRFTLGQWLKGRIYPQRSDLSPDGKHVIYFAAKGVAWTAISRAPYLKAIGLWKQSHRWNGGGLFVSSNRYWLNESFDMEAVQTPDELVMINEPADPETCAAIGECPGIYLPRLLRDGWRETGQQERRSGEHVTRLEKPARNGWTLRKIFHATSAERAPGRGCYWEEHELRNEDVVIAQPDWEWAEVDGRRLVWAERGVLYEGRVSAQGLDAVKALHDFNAMSFEPIAAPY